MYDSMTWTSDPRIPNSFLAMNVSYQGMYPPYFINGQLNYFPYAQPSEPFPVNIRTKHAACISKAELELNQAFRMLWSQHVAWTRMLIISIAANLPDEAFVTERLLRNAPDMAAVFRRYYGDEIAARFNNLMRDHLVFAAQLVKAAKAGDSQATADAEKRWYANADELAAFLSSINPYWPKQVLTNMLHEHLRMTKEEAVFRLNGNYKADIEAYDQVEKQALEMADAFTNGIVMQFPNAFR